MCKPSKADILIDAPLETVFKYVGAPENHSTMNPSIIDVTGVEELPNGGHEAEFTFQMLGRNLHGHETSTSSRRIDASSKSRTMSTLAQRMNCRARTSKHDMPLQTKSNHLDLAFLGD
ncbi:SRPBCC family protein [Halostella sp. JP-L12]|uniref:SRPBCC family protein n=1 Tax=Halostella TaxID=1843185 RepID=UPI000EF7DACE|nr:MULTISPECIES: SRPBCC family protein [Halostella]NHN49231.1 SRPBCC family protein [Halostella sp. JP-L12]